jgi:glycosyltransferase involved in cell wall biosynthesis
MRQAPAGRALVIFTPLPPKPNGIADYAFELLSGLSHEFDCTVVVADEQGEASAPPGVAVITATEYILAADRLEASLHLYQVGNNPDHTYMLPFMARRPGLVVLHDPSLHHLLDRVSVSSNDFSRYADALEAEHGVAGRRLGEQFRRYRLRERRMFFDMPMIRGIAAPSRGVIVHSRYAAVKILARAPQTPVTVVPHQYSPPRPETLEDPAAIRRALGVADDEILFMSLGFVTRAKRIDAALRALDIVRDRLPPFKYVIAGEFSEQEIDVKSLAAAFGLKDNVITLGYVEEHKFFSLIRAADVVINLRYPVAGETSGTLIRALGAGGCLVVVDRGPFAEIPDGAAVRVAWAADFEARLAQELLRLALDRGLRRRVGEKARDFIARNHSLDITVAGYKKAIAAAQAIAPPAWATTGLREFLPPHRLAEAVRAARAAEGAHALPLWFEAGAVPLRGDSVARTLVVGGDACDAALLERLGYAQDTERMGRIASDSVAPPPRAADLVIAHWDEALAGDDPEAALAWLNRALAFGGMLVWAGTTGDEASSPKVGAPLFEAYGFRVDAVFTGSPPRIDDPPERTGAAGGSEERCWRAVKVSETFCDPDFVLRLHSAGAPSIAAGRVT